MTNRPAYDLDAVRAHIPLLRHTVPMNACSQAPLTERTAAAARRHLDGWNERGMDWDAWVAEVEAAREAFARFVGAEAGDVAVATSVSQATASVAGALRWRGPEDGPGRGTRARRSTVVLTGAEFPTVAHAWMAHRRLGARIRRVPPRNGAVDLAAVADAVDEDTRVVSVAHGFYRTGALVDLSAAAELAHAAGALLFVDAYQTLGARRIDVEAAGIDMLACGTLKFLMGTAGLAFLYVRPALAERLQPLLTGWFGRVDPFAFDAERLDWAPGARRFDVGTPPVLPAYVSRAGMELLEDVGLDAVEAWSRTLVTATSDGARERGLEVLGPEEPERRGPTVAIAVPDGPRVEDVLRERGVLASARGSALRLAPHFYTSLGDVETALDATARAVADTTRDGPRGDRP